MLSIGQLSLGGFDTRWLVGVGLMFLAYALWPLNSWPSM